MTRNVWGSQCHSLPKPPEEVATQGAESEFQRFENGLPTQPHTQENSLHRGSQKWKTFFIRYPQLAHGGANKGADAL